MLHRLALTTLLLASSTWGFAAQLRVYGTVTDLATREPLTAVFVRIYKNGVVQQASHTTANGRYSARLDNNASYVIRFSMPGRVTKCYAVDTHGPEWEGDGRVVDLEVEMTLFETVHALDLSFFDMPLGIARFTPMTGVIAWNEQYEARIHGPLERLMAELQARREELAIRTSASEPGAQPR